ncbi:hypothetical protein GCM10027570_08680 [Streptomonospora sediminis]
MEQQHPQDRDAAQPVQCRQMPLWSYARPIGRDRVDFRHGADCPPAGSGSFPRSVAIVSRPEASAPRRIGPAPGDRGHWEGHRARHGDASPERAGDAAGFAAVRT